MLQQERLKLPLSFITIAAILCLITATPAWSDTEKAKEHYNAGIEATKAGNIG